MHQILNCIILKIVGMKLIFARPILNLSCFETSTSPNLKQEKIWFKKSLVTAPKEERLNYFLSPHFDFQKTGNSSAPLRNAIFCTKVNRFPNCIIRDQPRDISHIIYKLFSTVNQKKVPNKTQILWEDPSNSCFSFPFPNLKRGGRYLVLIFLMFEINFTIPTFNYNQVIYYMNSKIFCVVHIVIF